MLDLVGILLNIWQRSKHSFAVLIGIVFAAFVVFEFGSYVIARELDEMKLADEIRAKFIERRAQFEESYQSRIFALKVQTILVIEKSLSLNSCNMLKKQFNLDKLETNVIVYAADMKQFFGDDVQNEFNNFIKWYDINKNNCFKNVPNAEQTLDRKVSDIQQKMWEKMYPPQIIKGVQKD